MTILLSDRQEAILHLLARHKALSTQQLHQALSPGKPDTSPTAHTLQLLEKRGYVRKSLLEPQRGAASERLWSLLRPGADAIGAPHGSHYYRKPRPDQVAYRGLQLMIECQVRAAGWELIPPCSYGPGHPRPARTEQSIYLMRARYAWVDELIDDPRIPNQSIYDLIVAKNQKRLCTGWPLGANDYVAYRPSDPAHTVVLIPHPSTAGRQFWTQGAGGKKQPGRLVLYKPVAASFYCVAAFGDSATMRELDGVISTAGMIPRLADQIGEFLSRIADGSLQTPPPSPPRRV